MARSRKFPGILSGLAFLTALSLSALPATADAAGDRWTYQSQNNQITNQKVARDRSFFATVSGDGQRFGFACRQQEDASGRTIVAAPSLYLSSVKPISVQGKRVETGKVYDTVMTIDNDTFTMPMTATVGDKVSTLEIALDFTQKPVIILLTGLKKARKASFNGTDWSLRGSSKAINSLLDDCR